MNKQFLIVITNKSEKVIKKLFLARSVINLEVLCNCDFQKVGIYEDTIGKRSCRINFNKANKMYSLTELKHRFSV